MAKPKVLLTGASGYIAGLLLPAFRERYELTLVDVRDTDREGQPVEGVQIADLTQTAIEIPTAVSSAAWTLSSIAASHVLRTRTTRTNASRPSS